MRGVRPLLISFVFFLLMAHSTGGALAQEVEATKSAGTTVTAIVAPQGAPPTPGLITPKNTALLTSGVVTFQWTQVEHLSQIDRYDLYLNGTVYFHSLRNDQVTENFTLDLENGIYTLRLKPDKWLVDGDYTWKVRVIDVNNRGTDSTTWRFSIDSTPPNILLTQVGPHETAISAADPVTIPHEPLIVGRSPDIRGHTEANAQVQLVVTLANGRVVRYKTQAHQDGAFAFTLEPLPSRQVVTLTFISVDAVENTRVLDGVKIIYEPRVIRIPLPPLLPEPIVLEIDVLIPRAPSQLIPKEFPAIFGPLLGVEPEGITEPLKLVEVPVFDASPWILVWLFLLAGYILAVFFLTRNAWWSFGMYLITLLQFWIFGSQRGNNSVQTSTGEPVPFYLFALTWLDKEKKYHQLFRMTTPAGRWSFSPLTGVLYSVLNIHRAQVYPAKQLSPQPERTVLNGQSFVLTEASQGVDQQNAQIISVSSPLSVTLLTERQGRSVPGWELWCWLPRVFLFLEFFVTLYILWYVKSWLTIVMFVCVCVAILRDGYGKLRKRLEVYGA